MKPHFSTCLANAIQTFRTRQGRTRKSSAIFACRPVVELLEERALLAGDLGSADSIAAVSSAWGGYARDAQHTALSPVASQPLQQIAWQTPVDLAPQYNGELLLIHYGSPLVTAANTVIVPVKTGATNGFQVTGLDGLTGAVKWTQSTDYVLPPHAWVPSYSPTLTPAGRVYFAGAGGTIYFRDAPDTSGASTTGQLAFFGMANYAADSAAYDSTVFINTPITSDSAGNVYFGFQVTGANPLNLQGGIARIDPTGIGTWVAAAAAVGRRRMTKAAMNAAPALSNDARRCMSRSAEARAGYLVALDSATLAESGNPLRLKDPSGNDAWVSDNGSASPMIGPDGDVYFGVLENPSGYNHFRGWLLHFSGDLTQSLCCRGRLAGTSPLRWCRDRWFPATAARQSIC